MSEGYTQAEYDAKLKEAQDAIPKMPDLCQRIRFASREASDDERRPVLVRNALVQYLKHGRAW